ncbi:DNRLRE domain-containing protein [Pseudoflavitalea sp. G-6-1-2]|uniref:CBM96 family carbohydrate-binding protein n=1 Tax=Pseudoflavitalea sp. G-6-1-2 TaxID=2728841 RepID=UPI00146E028A|nr:DNRLRE domain-containing protein [Pseudoflavitalea sp. G-6-1-2]NML21762.1 DNRLRE domain-containing protein [Pseudoflavitalea sp. G-6-1-2]
MKHLYIAAFTLLFSVTANRSLAQIKLSADGPGNTYELIEGLGFGVENPECVHGSFGRHVTEVFDNTLNKYVFVFHSHPVEDNDRCQNFDRVRMEIKGDNGSPEELKHTLGETAYYRWKFKLDAGFIPSSRFTHIFQIKAIDGDAGAPLITITPRAGSPEKMQIIHSTGSDPGGLGTVKEVDLAPFKGQWVEAYVKYKSAEGSAGSFEITLRRMSDGATLLSYSNNSLDMWRTGGNVNRPKWGVYRGKDDVLRDEQVRFADFCVSETSADLCPSDIGTPNTPPTVSITSPANNATFTAPATVNITANAADADGTVSKVEFFNGSTKLGEDLAAPFEFSWSNVAAGSYTITAKATDNGNASTTSTAVNISVTAPPTCPPVIASGDDGNVAANVLDNNLATRWSASGDGQWIQFCLGSAANVTGVQIAFYNGNTRTSTFDVLVGNDGTNWTTAAAGKVSSGTSTALETFTFTPVNGKYVRIVGHGNSVNLWNSYTEVKIQTGSSGGGTFTLTPEADAYVRDGTNGAITHGTTDPTLLITKLSPSGQLNNARESYLRFDLSSVSGSVSNATLRVYGKIDLTTVPSVPIGVYAVANTTWSESALTWNNKPASGAGLDTNTVTNAAYAYITWDVTSYVQSELAASRNKVSFAMKSLTAHDPRVFWNSKEFGSNPPQLVVNTTSALAGNSAAIESQHTASLRKSASIRMQPNPFKGTGVVYFQLPEAGQTHLAVFDLQGKQVAVLVNAKLNAGEHNVRFNSGGKGTGIYILRLIHNGKTTSAKVQQE